MQKSVKQNIKSTTNDKNCALLVITITMQNYLHNNTHVLTGPITAHETVP